MGKQYIEALRPGDTVTLDVEVAEVRVAPEGVVVLLAAPTLRGPEGTIVEGHTTRDEMLKAQAEAVAAAEKG